MTIALAELAREGKVVLVKPSASPRSEVVEPCRQLEPCSLHPRSGAPPGFSLRAFNGSPDLVRHLSQQVAARMLLIEKLRSIDTDFAHDPEAAHLAADRALLEFIGDQAVTDAYDEVRREYP